MVLLESHNAIDAQGHVVDHDRNLRGMKPSGRTNGVANVQSQGELRLVEVRHDGRLFDDLTHVLRCQFGAQLLFIELDFGIALRERNGLIRALHLTL
ncbi:hypothetical protein [Sinorhizobium fredii]|uniref:hypothetical protein n=1 Tax=Rhizobium fredii TaxID=380 RepID=UPI0018E93CF1|nr:hypothetical protein [Sinorhizobium fredii]